MYQGSAAALFHEHNAIMLGLIIDVVTFTTALAAWVLATSNRNSPLFFKSVCLILGALACDLLLFILNPILGWVIFALGASTLVHLLYGSYKQIFESYQENFQSISNWLKQKFPQIFKSCQENLQPVLNWFEQKFQNIFEPCRENIQSVSNWFEQKFNSQSISQTSSQASNGFLMPTPNVIVKQAMKSEECLTEG